MGFPLYVTCNFSLVVFKTPSLFCISNVFIITHHGEFFWSCLKFNVLSVSIIHMTFLDLGEFLLWSCWWPSLYHWSSSMSINQRFVFLKMVSHNSCMFLSCILNISSHILCFCGAILPIYFHILILYLLLDPLCVKLSLSFVVCFWVFQFYLHSSLSFQQFSLLNLVFKSWIIIFFSFVMCFSWALLIYCWVYWFLKFAVTGSSLNYSSFLMKVTIVLLNFASWDSSRQFSLVSLDLGNTVLAIHIVRALGMWLGHVVFLPWLYIW